MKKSILKYVLFCVVSLSVPALSYAKAYVNSYNTPFSVGNLVQSVDDVCSSTLFLTGSDEPILNTYLKLSNEKTIRDTALGSYEMIVDSNKERNCVKRFQAYSSIEVVRNYDIALYKKTNRLHRHVFIRSMFNASLSNSDGFSYITFTQKMDNQNDIPPAQISLACIVNEGVCSVLNTQGNFAYSQGTDRLYELRGELSLNDVKKVFDLTEREYMYLKIPSLMVSQSYSF